MTKRIRFNIYVILDAIYKGKISPDMAIAKIGDIINGIERRAKK